MYKYVHTRTLVIKLKLYNQSPPHTVTNSEI